MVKANAGTSPDIGEVVNHRVCDQRLFLIWTIRIQSGLLNRGGDHEAGKPDVMANDPQRIEIQTLSIQYAGSDKMPQSVRLCQLAGVAAGFKRQVPGCGNPWLR